MPYCRPLSKSTSIIAGYYLFEIFWHCVMTFQSQSFHGVSCWLIHYFKQDLKRKVAKPHKSIGFILFSLCLSIQRTRRSGTTVICDSLSRNKEIELSKANFKLHGNIKMSQKVRLSGNMPFQFTQMECFVNESLPSKLLLFYTNST